MKRPVRSVRKLIVSFLSLLLVFCCAFALAAENTSEYTFESIPARLSVGDSFTVILPENMEQHTEFLFGKTAEDVRADWTARGVLMQAWRTKEKDACLEVRAVQDEDAQAYFDTDQQTNQGRTAFRTSHLKNAKYINQGYDIKNAAWKKQTNGGRFLRLKYKRTAGDTVYWGFAAKTVRNGWTVILDYQVYGRALKTNDEQNLNRIANSVYFDSSDALPYGSSALISFTSEPPAETNTGEFFLEGTTAPQAHLTTVAMRQSVSGSFIFETDANKAGKFKQKIQLPQEGVWCITMTVDDASGKELTEKFFESVVTYSATLIPVNFTTAVPETFSTDEFILSGVTVGHVKIQCIVEGGPKPFTKQIQTNNSGKFSFKFPTDTETVYNITLVFQKKNLDLRRKTWTVNRVMTEEDYRAQYRKEACKPAYNTLVRNLDSYAGRIMGYNVYVYDIQEAGDEWLMFCALKKNSKTGYGDIIILNSDKEPDVPKDTLVKVYARCVGPHSVEGVDDVTYYPSFDLLFWE